MALKMLLKIDQIAGESTLEEYEDTIEVLNWSWSAANTGTLHRGADKFSGAAEVQDLMITKYVDQATPTLLQFCCMGKKIDEATLVVRRTGENKMDYVQIVMSPAIVTSINSGGSEGEDRLTESLTLNFQNVKFIYKKDPDAADADFAFDIAAHKE